MTETPLTDIHRKTASEICEAYGWQLPFVYSTFKEEYISATKTVGLIDRSYVGRLKVTGSDGLDLLNRLSTNKLDYLELHCGSYTVLTSNKGRIIDLLFVLNLPDHQLVISSPDNRQKVIEWMDFYTFTEDVKVTDSTENTAMLSIVGPFAPKLIRELFNLDVNSLRSNESVFTNTGIIDALLIRTDFLNTVGYDLVIRNEEAGLLWQECLDSGAKYSLQPIGMKALEVIRIERGIPSYGKDISEENNPLEANLSHAISFNKGCYIGQEVVARLDTYDKVKRTLVGLSSRDNNLIAGSELLLDGKRVGMVTSAQESPVLGKSVGLGYVKKSTAIAGLQLMSKFKDGTESTILIEEIPHR